MPSLRKKTSYVEATSVRLSVRPSVRPATKISDFHRILSVFDWADCGLCNSRVVGEGDRPATCPYPELSKPLWQVYKMP